MAELADAPDLGSGGLPCRFKSCCPHHKKQDTVRCPAFYRPAQSTPDLWRAARRGIGLCGTPSNASAARAAKPRFQVPPQRATTGGSVRLSHGRRKTDPRDREQILPPSRQTGGSDRIPLLFPCSSSAPPPHSGIYTTSESANAFSSSTNVSAWERTMAWRPIPRYMAGPYP